MKRIVCLGFLIGLSWLLAACQQPYQVFAVQIAQAAPKSIAVKPATDPPAPTLAQSRGRRKRSRREKLDLNTASAAQLQALPGIGSALVAAMIAGRPYRAKRELLQRGIFTPSQYAQWKNDLVVHRHGRSTTTSSQP